MRLMSGKALSLVFSFFFIEARGRDEGDAERGENTQKLCKDLEETENEVET